MHDLSARLNDPALRDLVALSVGQNAARLDRALDRYRPAGGAVLFGEEIDGDLAGCLGFRQSAPGEGLILNIAVRPDHQRKGVARRMIDYLRRQLAYTSLESETDSEAVGFYRACGFSVMSLGETYPGIERFRCTWTEG